MSDHSRSPTACDVRICRDAYFIHALIYAATEMLTLLLILRTSSRSVPIVLVGESDGGMGVPEQRTAAGPLSYRLVFRDFVTCPEVLMMMSPRLMLCGMGGQRAEDRRGQVFISYVREDGARVDRLQSILERAGIGIWRDTRNVDPGHEWREEIRRAIMASSLAFIACFSENSERKNISFQNEELILAVEQMRLRVPGSSWLIPVRFAECRIPAFDLGAGRKLDALQYIDMFDGSWESGIPILLGTLLGNPYRSRYAGGVGIDSTYLGSQLGTGQAMYGSQYLMSDDNRFVFILQYDGNLVLYEPGYKPIWASATDGKGGTQLIMQDDGNLVLYKPTGEAVWASDTCGLSGDHLVVQADGNAVLYDSPTGAARWATGTGGQPAGLSFAGTSRLPAGAMLLPDYYIRSPDGRFVLVLQTDGNLVLMGPAFHPIWASSTSGHSPARLVMQEDGNLVLYDPDGAYWSSGTDGTDASRLEMQDDANAVIYGPSGALWATDTVDRT